MKTKIKLCGMMCLEDIEIANTLKPEYVGFIFAKKSWRKISFSQAEEFKKNLDPEILAVGVFVNEAPAVIADLLNKGIIDIAQLHGQEDESVIRELRSLTDMPLIKAFRIETEMDVRQAEESTADYILFDSGAGGTGTRFEWKLLKDISRPYFLAGGLTPENVASAIEQLHPYAVDVSSGIETNGVKDPGKMRKFVEESR